MNAKKTTGLRRAGGVHHTVLINDGGILALTLCQRVAELIDWCADTILNHTNLEKFFDIINVKRAVLGQKLCVKVITDLIFKDLGISRIDKLFQIRLIFLGVGLCHKLHTRGLCLGLNAFAVSDVKILFGKHAAVIHGCL